MMMMTIQAVLQDVCEGEHITTRCGSQVAMSNAGPSRMILSEVYRLLQLYRVLPTTDATVGRNFDVEAGERRFSGHPQRTSARRGGGSMAQCGQKWTRERRSIFTVISWSCHNTIAASFRRRTLSVVGPVVWILFLRPRPLIFMPGTLFFQRGGAVVPLIRWTPVPHGKPSSHTYLSLRSVTDC